MTVKHQNMDYLEVIDLYEKYKHSDREWLPKEGRLYSDESQTSTNPEEGVMAYVRIRKRRGLGGKMDIIDRAPWFTEEREKKLAANDYKGGWEDEDVSWLFKRLEEEVKELGRVLDKADAIFSNCPDKEFIPEIISEAADVANFAMMIADRVR